MVRHHRFDLIQQLITHPTDLFLIQPDNQIEVDVFEVSIYFSFFVLSILQINGHCIHILLNGSNQVLSKAL